METLTCPECAVETTQARCDTHGRICVAPDALSEMEKDALLGTVFAEKYRVIDVLGTGGFGRVYRAIDDSVDRPVAIKVIRERDGIDREHLRARFYREARILGRLTSDAAVPLHEYGERDGTLYMVMQYVRGMTLSALIDRVGRLSEARAVDIATQMLSGLAEAHALGLVHRDVKPSNLMVVEGPLGDERVKLLDFGIAKLQQEDVIVDDLSTETGVWLGSPSYMAPEQAKSKPTSQSDLYSVGVVLFEMLTGRRPFVGEHMLAVLSAHQTDPVPMHMEVMGISAGLCAVVHKALAKTPSARWQSASDMVAALRALALPHEPNRRIVETAPTVSAGPVLGNSTSMHMRGEVTSDAVELPGRPRARVVALGALAGIGLAVGAWLAFGGPTSEATVAGHAMPTAADAAIAVESVAPALEAAALPAAAAPAVPDAAVAVAEPAVDAMVIVPTPTPPIDARLDEIATLTEAWRLAETVAPFRAALDDKAIDGRAFKLRLMQEPRFAALRQSRTWGVLFPPRTRRPPAPVEAPPPKPVETPTW
ncbi:MAG: serine/threonine protein kinase [Myxococcales bacterium]|nr:serine/threonine protein kinase [Myxococcales bacterium]